MYKVKNRSSPLLLLPTNTVTFSEVNVVGKIPFILPIIFKMKTEMCVSLLSHFTWDVPCEDLSECLRNLDKDTNYFCV